MVGDNHPGCTYHAFMLFQRESCGLRGKPLASVWRGVCNVALLRPLLACLLFRQLCSQTGSPSTSRPFSYENRFSSAEARIYFPASRSSPDEDSPSRQYFHAAQHARQKSGTERRHLRGRSKLGEAEGSESRSRPRRIPESPAPKMSIFLASQYFSSSNFATGSRQYLGYGRWLFSTKTNNMEFSTKSTGLELRECVECGQSTYSAFFSEDRGKG